MTRPIHRRGFLNRAVLGGAAAGLSLGSPRGSASAAENRMVVAVLGTSRGRALAAGFARQPDVEVRYLCDPDLARGEAAAAFLAERGVEGCRAIPDFRRALDDSAVDAVVIATPNHWHAPATIMACAAGKHVYVEKPGSHNPYEGELMVRAARKHGRVVQMGNQRRSGPVYREAMEMLRNGAIGEVFLARSWYNASRTSIGRGRPAPVPPNLDYDLWQGPAPRTPYLDNRVPYNWHWFWHWGNGELGNNGVHALDACRWGLGVDFPVRVTSSGGRYWFDDDQETPDSHVVAFEFPGGKQIVWDGMSCNRKGCGFVTFYGSGGSLALDGTGGYVVYNEGVEEVGRDKGPLGDDEHIADFLAACRGGDPLSVSAEIEDAQRSTLLCHLGNIAHRTGRTLNCRPEDGRILSDDGAMVYWRRDYEPGWEPTV
jgi:predicted dehydrogenase